MYHYDVTIHMRYDPDDLNVDEFELEAENIEAAKQWIKETRKSVSSIIMLSIVLKKVQDNIVLSMNQIL